MQCQSTNHGNSTLPLPHPLPHPPSFILEARDGVLRTQFALASLGKKRQGAPVHRYCANCQEPRAALFCRRVCMMTYSCAKLAGASEISHSKQQLNGVSIRCMKQVLCRSPGLARASALGLGLAAAQLHPTDHKTQQQVADQLLSCLQPAPDAGDVDLLSKCNSAFRPNPRSDPQTQSCFQTQSPGPIPRPDSQTQSPDGCVSPYT